VPTPTPTSTSEPTVLRSSQLEQPIIPPYDVKPSVFVAQADAAPLGNIMLTIKLAESDLGLPRADQDQLDKAKQMRLASDQTKSDSSVQGQGASALTSSLDRSVGLRIGSESRTEQLPLPRNLLTRDMPLVISVDVSDPDQVIQSLEKAEVRRIQDIQSSIGGVEPPSGELTELSSPALRQQLETATRAVRAGAASSNTGIKAP
jgi:hypothetical protein